MQEMAAAVTAAGGTFVEAPVSGSKGPAAAGQLIFLCAGDLATYEAAAADLDLMGKAKFHFGEVGTGGDFFEIFTTRRHTSPPRVCSIYLLFEVFFGRSARACFDRPSQVGAGTKMKLVVNMTMGSMMASLRLGPHKQRTTRRRTENNMSAPHDKKCTTCLLKEKSTICRLPGRTHGTSDATTSASSPSGRLCSEGCALAEASGLSQPQLLEVLDLGVMANPLFKLKGPGVVGRSHANTQFPLKHAQKDMRFALGLGAQTGQPLPVAAAASATMEAAMEAGFGDADFSATYEGCRPAPAP